jgi:hypothetical protein
MPRLSARSASPPWPMPFSELQNAPDAGELSREDWLGLLVDREATSRENGLPAACARPDCASPPWTPWTILCRLTGTTGLMQPLLVSTVQIAATLSPTRSAASSRDHDHRNP